MKHPTHSRHLLMGMALIGLLAAVPALAQETREVHDSGGPPHDLYWLFNRYWWLLFPLFWGIRQMIKYVLRHKRAQAALEALQSYAVQGKEPPAELVAVLRQPDKDIPRINGGNFATYGWIPVFLFGALTCGFVVMAIWSPDAGVSRPAMFFVAIIMAGLCLGNLMTMLARKNQDRIPPP